MLARAAVSNLRQGRAKANGHNRANALECGLPRGCIAGLTDLPGSGTAPAKWRSTQCASVSEMDTAKRCCSVQQVLPDQLEGRTVAHRPIAADDPIGLLVLLQPVLRGLEERLALL